MDEHPKFRSDVQVSEQHAREGTVYVLKEPVTGRIFRIPQAEYFIAQRLDGATAPDVIRREVEEKFGDTVSPDEMTAFIAQLRQLGLLEDKTASTTAPQRRLRGELLYLRLKAFDPDVRLERLSRTLRFCFTPGFIVACATLIVIAIGVVIANWDEIRPEITALYRFNAIVYAWVVLLFTASLHEVAHGLTCKHFGGQVHEMGFMLIYFQPALYCNVSDAWLFPKKTARLWVTFAGAFFDISLWALGVLVWRITDPDSWVNFTALVIVATLGIRTLFNLNPLIKLDGYYLLGDMLDIPNLRARAFRFLRGLWRRLWHGSSSAVDEASTRERRIFIAYGVLAGIYSFGLLSMIAWWFGRYMVDRYGTLGFMLFTVLLTTALRHPLRRTLLRLPQGVRQGPSWFRSLSRPVRAVAIAGMLSAGLFLIPKTVIVSGDVTLLPFENADVRAEVEGVLSEIHVVEGDAVEAGAPIAGISDHKYRIELHEVEAWTLEKRARLRQLKAGSESGAARLGVAEASVAKQKEQLRREEQNLARMRSLVEEGFYSRTRLDDAASEVFVRRRELEEAQMTLQILHGEAEATEAEIARLEARRDYLLDRLDRLLIRSPHAGVITTPKIEQKIGQYVKEGDLIAEVHERRYVIAEIAVTEREIGDVQVGRPVLLKVRAYPNKTFRGAVARIAPATEQSEKLTASKIVRVTTIIDNPEQLLKTGMTGYAKIECDKRSLIAVLGRSVVNTLRIELWSWW